MHLCTGVRVYMPAMCCSDAISRFALSMVTDTPLHHINVSSKTIFHIIPRFLLSSPLLTHSDHFYNSIVSLMVLSDVSVMMALVLIVLSSAIQPLQSQGSNTTCLCSVLVCTTALLPSGTSPSSSSVTWFPTEYFLHSSTCLLYTSPR